MRREDPETAKDPKRGEEESLEKNVTDYPDWNSTLHTLFSGLEPANGHYHPLPYLPLPPALSLGQVYSEDPKEHQVIRILGDPGSQQAGGQGRFPVAQGLDTKTLVMNYSLELC